MRRDQHGMADVAQAENRNRGRGCFRARSHPSEWSARRSCSGRCAKDTGPESSLKNDRAGLREADRCPPFRWDSGWPSPETALRADAVVFPMVTVCSCIASSSADCVFGVARLISSARQRWVKMGPGWKRSTRPPPSVSIIILPTMSPGIRSGVKLDPRIFQMQYARKRSQKGSSFPIPERLPATRGRQRAGR